MDHNGETSFKNLYVGSLPDSVLVIADTTIDMGGAAILSAYGYGGTNEFNGTRSTIYDCDDCADVIMSPLVTSYAVVEYYSTDGCPISDSVLVTVNFEDVIDVPTNFSPDFNGINDLVFVKDGNYINGF